MSLRFCSGSAPGISEIRINLDDAVLFSDMRVEPARLLINLTRLVSFILTKVSNALDLFLKHNVYKRNEALISKKLNIF